MRSLEGATSNTYMLGAMFTNTKLTGAAVAPPLLQSEKSSKKIVMGS